MRSLLARLFSATLYLRIGENRMALRYIEGQRSAEHSAADSFSTGRLLIGQFRAAERCLKQCAESLGGLPVLSRPVVVVHPLALVSGGLSEVEERSILELIEVVLRPARSSIWMGEELLDHRVKEIAGAT